MSRKVSPSLPEFNHLYSEAKELLPECTGRVDQVIALKCESGKIFVRKVTALSDDEDTLVSDIGNDAVKLLVCLWGDGALDMPFYDFRKNLITQNENSENTEILLLGYKKLIKKTFSQIMK